jgi:hypothetical protein
MVKLTRNPNGQQHTVEAELTDVDLPGAVNYGVGQDETEAIANLKQKVDEYRRSLEQLDYTVLRN